ncbi:MAG: ATP-grasp domain-containing protein [Candidatus Omnitrophica bacterium]|nr:ATP-grasp domain-containing protein [Candidatus Omnitrophota bacterium]
MEIKDKKLLITDPYTPQSYDLILALKSMCKRIVVAMPYIGRFSRIFCFTANSHWVSKIYHLKSEFLTMEEIALEENSEKIINKEKDYYNEVLNICEKENIDLIYPTNDNEVLFFAKYKQKFKQKRVIIPVNNYEVLKGIMDKFNVIQLAQKEGVPCPQTYLVSELNIQKKELFSSPKIIKPRFANASRGVCLIKSRDEFRKWLSQHKDESNKFIIQEYIPGDKIVYYRVYMKKEGVPLVTSCVACQRPEMILHQSCGLIMEKEEAPEFWQKIVSLFSKQGYTGYAHAQLKVDERDGIPKLMEINPRISRGTWAETKLGLNGPMTSMLLLEGKNNIKLQVKDNSSIIFVWPMQDLFIFIFFLGIYIKEIIFNKILGRKEQIRKIPTLQEMFKHYSNIYISRKKNKITSNYFSNFFKDPKVSLSYWLSFCYSLKRMFKNCSVYNLN